MTITITLLLRLGIILLIIAAVFSYLIWNDTWTDEMMIIRNTTLVLGLVLLAGTIAIGENGNARGASTTDRKTMPVTDFIKTAGIMPKTAPDDTEIEEPCLILWTDFGNETCRAVIPDMMEDLKTVTVPVYVIDVETKLAQSILEEHPEQKVDAVPTFTIWNGNGISYSQSPVTYDTDGPAYDHDGIQSFLGAVR